MKKPLKISLIVAGSIAVLLIIVSLLISPIAKWYIEKNSKELIGRVITMDKLRLNIFTGSLKILKFNIKEKDEKTSFINFDTLSVKVKLFDFLQHKVTVRKVHLSNFYVNVWQNDSTFNFDDIIRKFNTPDSVQNQNDTVSSTWEIGIYDIQLHNGDVHYKDLAINGKWDIENFSLNIPGVYFAGKTTDIGFKLTFTNGGSLISKLKYDIEKSIFDLHLDLEKFTLAGLLPYMQQSMQLRNIDGFLETHLDIIGDMNHIQNLMVKGTVALTALNMKDKEDELILAADRILVDMASIDLQNSKYRLNEFFTQGLSTRFTMYKDSSNNFTRLLKPEKKPAEETVSAEKTVDTTAASSPMQLSIAKLNINGRNIRVEDRALQVPFAYDLKELSVKSDNFDLNGKNKINIQGKIGSTGIATINWNGNFNNFSTLDLKLSMQHVALKDFTPYTLEYTAYPIANGILTVSSQNAIRNNHLKSTNGLNIYKCDVEKSRKDITPVMKVPLRTALYILKDRNEEIKIDLPVEGYINSPEFSYKKLILKTLSNLLVKVAMAPFDALAQTMGFNPEQLEEIPFDALQDEFTPVGYDKFGQLANILLAKPELQLSMLQYIDRGKVMNDLSIRELKYNFAVSKNPNGTPEDIALVTAKISDTDPALSAFADSKLSTPITGDIYAKAYVLYKAQAAQKFDLFAAKRNQLFVDYMTGLKVPLVNLKVETIPPDSTYTGKSFYKTGLSMDN